MMTFKDLKKSASFLDSLALSETDRAREPEPWDIDFDCPGPSPALLKTANNLPATDEQLKIFSFLINDKENLIVNASAGSSKTTTIVEGITRVCDEGALAPKDIIALAFNKSIADTLAEKMPTGVASKTLNAVGHQALRGFLGSVSVNTKKTSQVLAETIPDFYSLNPAERRTIKSMFQLAKMNGIWPDEDEWAEAQIYYGKKTNFPQLRKQIAQRSGSRSFFQRYINEHDVGVLSEYIELLPLAYALDIITSLETRQIEFVDQIFLTASLASVTLQRYKMVVVDEAQDLSRIEQFILSLLVSTVPKGRLVAVGDKAQAIYAFKGADPQAFKALKEKWNAESLLLSTSFRCSHAVVKEAQTLDDRIKPWENALKGEVKQLNEGQWDWRDLPRDIALLCRVNAPLIQAAVSMIKTGISCEFIGRDIEEQLNTFFQLHSKNMHSMTGFYHGLKLQIRQKEEKEPWTANKMQDSLDCLEAIFNLYDVQEVNKGESAIRRFFLQEGSIKLLSIHKAKGLEFQHVGLLRPDLLPHPKAVESQDPDQLQQEDNMKYVAITRAIDTFTYLYGKDFEGK